MIMQLPIPKIKKWKLKAKSNISPSPWFPMENRVYRLTDGKTVSDFSVATFLDVSMVLPITKEGRVVLVRQFRPGVNEILLQFPAGLREEDHKNMLDTAQHELEEETGIKVEKKQLRKFGVLATFPTKSSNKVHFFLATNSEFNSKQHLDVNEVIEVVQVSFTEIDTMITNGDISCAQTVACWLLAKHTFPELFNLKI